MENGNLVPPIVKPPSHIDFYIKSEMSNLKKLNQSVSSAGGDVDDEEMKVDGETIDRFALNYPTMANSGRKRIWCIFFAD